jgi:hypothetical protein
VLKDDYPKAIADLLGIPPMQGIAGPWMSSQGTVLGDWVRAVAEVLDIGYTDKVATMQAMVESVGETWNPATMASTTAPKGGGGNISKPGFVALLKGLDRQPTAQQRRRANAGSPPFQKSTPDARDDRVVMQAIRRRKGQPEFRANLLVAYESRCCISGCDASAVLEAAHITAYGSGGSYETCNGLLLRADLHTLFDLHLLAIDVDTGSVLLHPNLGGTTYASEIMVWKYRPASTPDTPDRAALKAHRAACGF